MIFKDPKRSPLRLSSLEFLVLAGLVIILSLAVPQVASGGHAGWHAQSSSYDFYLGIAPVDQVKRDRFHASAHSELKSLGSTGRHLTVAVIHRPTLRRVGQASVTARVVENDLVHRQVTRVSLLTDPEEPMPTFCGFFQAHWNGTYHVEVTVQEPGKAPEVVTFEQQEFGLTS
jgi:hypothetical protein